MQEQNTAQPIPIRRQHEPTPAELRQKFPGWHPSIDPQGVYRAVRSNPHARVWGHTAIELQEALEAWSEPSPDDLREEFPGWHIFTDPAGAHWAIRSNPDARLSANTTTALRDMLLAWIWQNAQDEQAGQ